jgi:hypothetical protein
VENWRAAAGSSDGSKLVAAVFGGRIFSYIDSGSTWVQTTAPSNIWTSVASSADGSKLAAAGSYFGFGESTPIYLSTDSGKTWTTAAAPTTFWTGIASSADGTRLAACVFDGLVYTSQSGTYLNISLLSGRIAVSWPEAFSGLVLQQSSSLSPASWTNVTVSPVVTNGQNMVFIPTPTGNSFYRLH